MVKSQSLFFLTNRNAGTDLPAAPPLLLLLLLHVKG